VRIIVTCAIKIPAPTAMVSCLFDGMVIFAREEANTGILTFRHGAIFGRDEASCSVKISDGWGWQTVNLLCGGNTYKCRNIRKYPKKIDPVTFKYLNKVVTNQEWKNDVNEAIQQFRSRNVNGTVRQVPKAPAAARSNAKQARRVKQTHRAKQARQSSATPKQDQRNPIVPQDVPDASASRSQKPESGSKKKEGWMATVKSYLPHLVIASVLAVTYWFFPQSESSSGGLSTASKCGIAAGLAGVTAIGGTLAYRARTKKGESDSIVDEPIIGSKKRKTRSKTKPQENSSTDNHKTFLIVGALCLVGLLVVVFCLNGSEDSTEVDDCPV